MAIAAPPLHLPEPDARAVMWVRAFERDGTDAVWTAEDRAWATRLAREDPALAGASPAGRLALRARHALQRLRARDERCARSLDARPWRAAWPWLALLLGLAAGVAIDQVGSSQRLNLLAPPLWAVVGWNLLVFVMLAGHAVVAAVVALLGRGRPPSMRGLPRWLAGAQLPAGRSRANGVFAMEWAALAAPLWRARAALLLHLAAAGLALGLVLGLGVRGLVLDYRAAWQSTFLDAPQVQAAVDTLLAPAARLGGVPVPDVAPLRVTAPEQPAVGPAAPWFILYAITLGIAVVLPRLLLAGWAAWRAARAAARLPLPIDDGHFHHLLRQMQGAGVRVRLHPQPGLPPAPLQHDVTRWIEAAWGGTLAVVLDDAGEPATAHLAVVDLATTPEAEVQGRWLEALRVQHPGAPWALLADETAFATRFAHLPERLDQRRRSWHDWGRAHRLPVFVVDFRQGASPADGPAVRQWLG